MKALFAVAVGVLITAGLIAGGWYFLREPGKRPKEKTGRPAAQDEPRGPLVRKPKHPYPECEECLRQLRQRVGEPDTIEVISWSRDDRRAIWRSTRTWIGMIDLSYRARGKFGAMRVYSARFMLGKEGKVSLSSVAPDDD